MSGWLKAALWAFTCWLPAATRPDGVRYLEEREFRRAALVASLTSSSNGYAALRLGHYATGTATDWDRRPEWNPRGEPIAPGDDAARPLGLSAEPLTISPAALSGDAEALRALGEAAFFRYPTQLVPYMASIVGAPAVSDRYGLWSTAQQVGGLVRVGLVSGKVGIALSCSTCHARSENGALLIGAANQHLDLGALMHDVDPHLTPARRATVDTWGSGRVDVTTLVGDEPVRIPDLRPTRYVTHLQHTAAVIHHDVISLAVRIETLLVTAHDGAVRPPRAVALGLAVYLYSLADALPRRAPATPQERRGAALFAQHCAHCHAPPGYTGAPVALPEIGTDAKLGQSLVRGTGMYRVPSLRGLATRGPLLHDGTLADATALLDPARLAPAYQTLHGTGPVPGHRFGLDLGITARADLVAFMGTL